MSAGGGRVYFSVFAGRRRFLSVLMLYVDPMLRSGLIHQAHLWDYCRLSADREYLKTLSAPAVRIMTPPASDRAAKFPNKWKGYYAYYATALTAADWLIKCDDDVVFLSNLAVLLQFARNDTQRRHLYFPSIVNNDVAAAFQAADGVIEQPEYVVKLQPSTHEGQFSMSPMSDWYNCTECANFILHRFLEAPARFFTGCVHEWSVAARVPINFFLMRGAAARSHFAAYLQEPFVDEAYLTALLTERSGIPSVMVTDAVVVHFSFAFQHVPDRQALLAKFRKMAQDLQPSAQLEQQFSGRRLNLSCRNAPPPHLQRHARNRPNKLVRSSS
ncbi:hypothetical protein AB1Y20_011891 [Prymnesium parvum]|uniref:Hexosyltransferase n=1 Tax=Prymnesium parvum TaxID=97485 RepID=A0AB34IKG3_PRYPA